jgi:hypothetical protein
MMRKPNDRHPPAKATDTGSPTACINYDEAVRKGRSIVARIEGQMSREKMRLEPRYGDRTVAKF